MITFNRTRRAFTLVETCVALGVVAALLCILLPAIQSAREATRRIQCVGNLRQVGLAINNYCTTYSCYPSICVRSYPDSPTSNFTYSPIAQMLPYLEQGSLYNSINFFNVTASADSLAVNHTVMVTSLSVLLCPSDGVPTLPGYGRTNYRFQIGSSPSVVSIPSFVGSTTEAFSSFVYRRPGDFPDGLSQTVGASERLQGDWTRGPFRRGGDVFMVPVSAGINLSDPDLTISGCDARPDSDPVDSGGEKPGSSWG